MKFLLIFSMLSLSALTAPVAKQGYKVKAHLMHKANDTSKTLESSGEYIIPANAKNWVSLTPGKDGVILLGKLAESTKDQLNMEFMVVNTKKAKKAVAQTKSLTVAYGKKTKYSLKMGTLEEAEITLSAKPTKYFVNTAPATQKPVETKAPPVNAQ